MPTPVSLELPMIGAPKKKPHRYGPDNPPPGIGRGRGTVNKITKDLKNSILQGAIEHGFDGNGLDALDGYCRFLAAYHVKSYVHLLGKLLPHVVNGTVEASTVSSIVVRTVAHGAFLSKADVMAMTPPLTIDQPAQHDGFVDGDDSAE